MSGRRSAAPVLAWMLWLWASLLLCSCGAPAPDSYPPPLQRRLAEGPEPRTVSNFVSMNDADLDAYVVRDVASATEGGAWRWTFERPELRFWVERTENQKLVADFAIAAATFEQTGPVTVTFYVNDRLLGRQACPRPGHYHFEKPVPAAWLRTDTFTHVAAQADKLWISPSDGARLGFILARIGFVS